MDGYENDGNWNAKVGVHLFVHFNHGKQATLASFCVALSIGLHGGHRSIRSIGRSIIWCDGFDRFDIRSAPNFVKTRFRRFAIFDFLLPLSQQ